jgi:hypothetical protein
MRREHQGSCWETRVLPISRGNLVTLFCSYLRSPILATSGASVRPQLTCPLTSGPLLPRAFFSAFITGFSVSALEVNSYRFKAQLDNLLVVYFG